MVGAEPDRREPGKIGEAGDRSTEELRSVAYRRLWGTAWKTKIEEDMG